MSPRTIFLGRLVGLYCIFIALFMITHKQAAMEAVTGLLRDPTMMLVLGAFTLIAGLAMVLAHSIWSGGVLPVVVTLIGWSTLARGLLFLFVAPHAAAGFYFGVLHFNQLFYLYMVVAFALGTYLAYSGFASKLRQ